MRATRDFFSALPWLTLHFAGYLLLLGWVVRLFPPNPALPNAAARSGYDTELAFALAAGWTVLGVLGFLLRRRRGAELATTADEPAPAPASLPPQVPPGRAALELALVAACAILLYFPPFLSRHGHYLEDNYFLYVLSRMEAGELPYRDFEFLYGPLMIYPARAFVKLFGFSMTSYFALVALMEAAFFTGLMRVLQRFLPAPGRRYLAFLLLAPLFLNSLLGLNYSGFRQGFVLLALLLLSLRGRELRAALAGGALCGVELAYSYEYGLMGLFAALGLYAASLLGRERGRTVLLAGACLLGAVVSWLVLALVLTRGTFPDYLRSSLTVLRQASATGLGRFGFYWTLNSLASFALLSVGVAAVGSGWFRFASRESSFGDRLLLAGLLFALGTLKIGLQRADVWHLTPPFLLLALAFAVDPPRRAFALSGLGAVPVWLVGVIGVTRLIGMHVTLSFVLNGLMHGAYDTLRGQPRGGGIAMRGYSVENERSWPNADFVRLGNYLAEPARADRPVLFYGDRWWLAYHTGVRPSGYAFYVLLYSDELKPLRSELLAHPRTLIVLSQDAYDLAYSGKPLASDPGPLPRAIRLAGWLGSVHFSQARIERTIKYELWQRRFGDLLRSRYRLAATFGDQLVLEPL